MACHFDCGGGGHFFVLGSWPPFRILALVPVLTLPNRGSEFFGPLLDTPLPPADVKRHGHPAADIQLQSQVSLSGGAAMMKADDGTNDLRRASSSFEDFLIIRLHLTSCTQIIVKFFLKFIVSNVSCT